MSKTSDIIVDDLNYRKEQQDIEYIKNLEEQVRLSDELIKAKQHVINDLTVDKLALEAQLKVTDELIIKIQEIISSNL